MSKLDYYKEISDLVERLPKHVYVAFAVHCAKDQLHNITDKDHHSKCLEALDITEKYMKGLATKVELENAAYAAHNAAYAAHNAKEIKLKEYYEVLVSMINNLSKLEKLIYEI